MPVTIYHNPRCSTSRKVLDAVRAKGIEPSIVLYLETPPSRATLEAWLKAMNASPRGLLRKKEPLCAALGLTDPKVSDDEILDALARHPALIERPVVETDKGVVLCRPPERLGEVL